MGDPERAHGWTRAPDTRYRLQSLDVECMEVEPARADQRRRPAPKGAVRVLITGTLSGEAGPTGLRWRRGARARRRRLTDDMTRGAACRRPVVASPPARCALRLLSTVALAGTLVGCASAREQRIDELERQPAIRQILVSGRLVARCRLAHRPQTDVVVELIDPRSESEVARTRTRPDGSFTLSARRTIDGGYALKVLGHRQDLPENDALVYRVALSLPCEADDPVGLLASFQSPRSPTPATSDPNAGFEGPDGQGERPQSFEERQSIQRAPAQ